MIRRILVAIDGSPSSNAAAAVAMRMAVQHKAGIEAIAILNTDFLQRPQAVPAGALSYGHTLDLRRFKDAAQRASAVLDDFRGRSQQAGVQFIGRIVEGEPLTAIESAATICDLIVVGKTSLYSAGGEMSSLPICIEQMLRACVRPVLLVPDLQAVGEAGRELAPIVVGFDGSATSSRSLHLFAQLGLGRGRQIHVLAQNDRSIKNAEATASQACELLREHGLQRVRAIGLENRQAGRPAEAILGAAKSVDAGLIVMGAYGQTGIRELFGSCTRSVLSGMQTPLFLYN